MELKGNEGNIRTKERFRTYTARQIQNIFDEARVNMRLAVCLPGKSWGLEFSEAFDEIGELCHEYGFPISITRAYDCNIYTVRNKCLCGDPRRPKDQPTMSGWNYTHTLWIDSDTVVPVSSFLTMLTNYKYDIVSGMVKTREDEGYAVYTMDNYDEGARRFFPWKGQIDAYDGWPFEVEFTGLAFTLVKKEVYEKIMYPWFRPVEKMMWTGPENTDFNVDFDSEDAGFCSLAKQNGFRVWADPRILCGHMKERMLL